MSKSEVTMHMDDGATVKVNADGSTEVTADSSVSYSDVIMDDGTPVRLNPDGSGTIEPPKDSPASREYMAATGHRIAPTPRQSVCDAFPSACFIPHPHSHVSQRPTHPLDAPAVPHVATEPMHDVPIVKRDTDIGAEGI